MATASPPEPPVSLLPVTLRRASVSGRFFLVYGTGVATFLGLVLVVTSRTTYGTTFPLLLPIFGTVGSMGGLLVFTNDRTKGVLEYLLAYGLSPQRLFTNVLLTGLALVSIVLTVSVGASAALYTLSGGPVTAPLLVAMFGYGVPMAYACSGFAAILGMYWTALSSPRQGMSSPIGLVPLLGILPAMATLGLVGVVAARGDAGPTILALVLVCACAAVALVDATLLALSGRLLRRERLLSPA